MQETRETQQPIELTEELPSGGGVYFDSENLLLQGAYTDQISAYRAKRSWAEALEANFLLESGNDFKIRVAEDHNASTFVLNCKFITACGRYAFWRLTNNQAPEAQYLIETGHIPQCESSHTQLMQAPDLKPVREEPTILGKVAEENSKLASWIRGIIKRMI